MVRAAAARSTILYVLANLFFGVWLSSLPAPQARRAYRAVLLAELASG